MADGLTTDELRGLLRVYGHEGCAPVFERWDQDVDHVADAAVTYSRATDGGSRGGADFISGVGFGLLIAERIHQLEEIRS